MKIKFEWKEICKDKYQLTHRAKVIGGWLVRHRELFGESDGECLSMVFVPDPTHIWEV